MQNWYQQRKRTVNQSEARYWHPEKFQFLSPPATTITRRRGRLTHMSNMGVPTIRKESPKARSEEGFLENQRREYNEVIQRSCFFAGFLAFCTLKIGKRNNNRSREDCKDIPEETSAECLNSAVCIFVIVHSIDRIGTFGGFLFLRTQLGSSGVDDHLRNLGLLSGFVGDVRISRLCGECVR